MDDEARLNRDSHLRDLATRLDGVLHHLSKPNEAQSSPVRYCEEGSCSHGVETPVDLIDHYNTKSCGIDTSINHNQATPSSVLRETWTNRLGLDHWLLNHLLRRYCTMQHFFPFVVIRETWGLTYMSANRPLLLLAIISSAACSHPQLQQKLVKCLRESLTRQAMVGGESSLDLLQAMLVHLSWFQYELVPRSQLIYRYLQVAIGVCVDLRLDQAYDEPEAVRASLGCSYLSSSISSFWIKRNTLPLNDDTFSKAALLARGSDVAFDSTIMPMIRYQRVVDNVVETYKVSWQSDDMLQLPNYAERMVTMLQEWWNTLPQYLQSTCLWKNRYYYALIRIYEMGLLFHFRVRDEAIFSAQSSPGLVTNLLACVDAIKKYLDTLLRIEGASWDIIPCEEWNRMIVAFFVLYKLSAGPREVSGWNVSMCRSRIDLEYYLETIADRLCNAAYTLEGTPNTSEGLFFVLPDVLRSAKASFIAVRDAPYLVRPGGRVHMDLSKEKIAEEVARPSSQRRCPATSFWTDSALVLDQETDWRTVDLAQTPDPAAHLASSEKLWRDLLGGQWTEYRGRA